MKKHSFLTVLLLPLLCHPAHAQAPDFAVSDEECRSAIKAQVDRQYNNHQYAEEQYSWSKARTDERMKDQADIRADSIRIADENPRPCAEALPEMLDRTLGRLQEPLSRVTRDLDGKTNDPNEINQAQYDKLLLTLGHRCLDGWNGYSDYLADVNSIRALAQENSARADAIHKAIDAQPAILFVSPKSEKICEDSSPSHFNDGFKATLDSIEEGKRAVLKNADAMDALKDKIQKNLDGAKTKFHRGVSCLAHRYFDEPADMAVSHLDSLVHQTREAIDEAGQLARIERANKRLDSESQAMLDHAHCRRARGHASETAEKQNSDGSVNATAR